MNFFETLPTEIILSIIHKLELGDQVRLAQVDQRFKELTHDKNTSLAKFKEATTRKWNEAVKSKNVKTMQDFLIAGLIPPDVNAKVTIPVNYLVNNDWVTQEKPTDLISMLLLCAQKKTDTVCFDTADKLLKKQGATLPPLPGYIKQENKAEYFKSLIGYMRWCDLYIALRTNPKIIQEQDETGKTLLHYGATMVDQRLNEDNTPLILYLLCNAPDVDFNITDNDGNTPLHLAALNCRTSLVYRCIFPKYLEHALKNHFDFSMQNKQGETVLHIAAKARNMATGGSGNSLDIDCYWSLESNEANVVKILLEKCPRHYLHLDDLSYSGATAFYHAIEAMCLNEAYTLLDNGANPIRFAVDKKPEKNPLKIIEKHIEFCKEQLNNPIVILKVASRHYDYCIKKLTELRERILKYILKNYILNYAPVEQEPAKDNNPTSHISPRPK